MNNAVVLSPTQKADNTLVPASLQDKRIMASFLSYTIDVKLLALFRQAALAFYQKNL